MSARAFLFAADALRIEDGVSFHVETENGKSVSTPDVANQNAQAFAALTGMMAGVKKR